MKKPGYPNLGELVVCEITKINPNSAYANLLEYDRIGMIHVSEVAKRWVRNIREFVKENSLVVCEVLRVEPNAISLSLKRVNRSRSDRKLQEYKKERNAEKLMEQVAKQLKKSLGEAYETVGYKLLDEFGSLHRTFEIALKNPDLLTEKGVDKKWAETIIEIAKKSFVKKIFEVRAMLSLICYDPRGVDVIKGVLSGVSGKGMEVKYISAPKYMVIGKGENVKEIREVVENVCNEAVAAVEKAGGEGDFSFI